MPTPSTLSLIFGVESFEQAMKLAERTIQFADTLTVLTDGYIKAGRVCHAEGSILDATRHFTEATKAPVVSAIAAIGLAQIQLKTGESLAGRQMLGLGSTAPCRRNSCRHSYAGFPPSIP